MLVISSGMSLLDLIIIVLSAYGMAIVVEMVRDLSDKIYDLTNFKPFNCKICLSFWFGSLIAYLYGYDLFLSILYGFVSLSIVYLLKRLEV